MVSILTFSQSEMKLQKFTLHHIPHNLFYIKLIHIHGSHTDRL